MKLNRSGTSVPRTEPVISHSATTEISTAIGTSRAQVVHEELVRLRADVRPARDVEADAGSSWPRRESSRSCRRGRSFTNSSSLIAVERDVDRRGASRRATTIVFG